MLKLTETDSKTVWFQLWFKNKTKSKFGNGVWSSTGVKYPLIYDDTRFHVAFEKLTSKLYIPYEVGKAPSKDKPLSIDYEKARELYRDSNGVHQQLNDIFSDWSIQPQEKPARAKRVKKPDEVKAKIEITYDKAIIEAVEKYKAGIKQPKGLVTLARKFLGEIK